MNLKVEARVVAFSPSFKGRTGEMVAFPKYTLRVGDQIVEAPVRGVEAPEKFLDKDVVLECDVFPAKTKQASLRVVSVTLAK